MRRSRRVFSRRGRKFRGRGRRRVRAEIKHAFVGAASGTGGDQYITFNSGISGSGDILQVMPGITQGTAANQRIGNKIFLKTITIRGRIRDLSTAATINVDSPADQCHLVRLMVLEHKKYRSYEDQINIGGETSTLLKMGDTSVAYNGTTVKHDLPVNGERWRLLAQRKFMTKNTLSGNVTVSGATTYQIDHAMRSFKITLRVNRVMTYDSNNMYPTNFGPIMCLGYTHGNCSAADVTDQMIGMFYTVNAYYTDV